MMGKNKKSTSNKDKKEFAFSYYNTNSEGIINAGPYTGLSIKEIKN